MNNIEVGNSEILEKGELKLSRSAKAGIAIVMCLGMGIGSIAAEQITQGELNKYSETVATFSEIPLRDQIFVDEDEIIIPYEQEDPINVSLEEINSLNIIINDSNCSDELINEICKELDRDGIKYTFTRNSESINVEGAVVITLDQQYIAGPGTVVFAPLENGRKGNSDALALAAERAFYEKGFLIDGVACGQMGFAENEDGTVSERVPTQAEASISSDKEASFVTISFGTHNVSSKLAAASIEATLTRFYSYIEAGYGNEDLIYCVEDGQGYSEIADILGTTEQTLDNFNRTSDEDMLLTGETLINPNVSFRREFDKHVPTNLYIDKTLWSK